MQEEQVKKRGWVKNAAIIFLAVLLVLTFFSNTIMNRSLPEVAGQNAQSGSITTRIRGSATITAAEVYEVKLLENRKVKTVAVRVGDEVVVGDVLFIMAEGDSETLATAKDELEAAELAYKRALLSATKFDYVRENREIQQLTDQLKAAEAERDSLVVDDTAYDAAKKAQASAQVKADSARTAVTAAEAAVKTALSKFDGSPAVRTALDKLISADEALSAAQAAFDEAYATCKDDYDALDDEATKRIKATPDYKAKPANEQEAFIRNNLTTYMKIVADESAAAGGDTVDLTACYTTMKPLLEKLNAAQEAVTTAQKNYDDACTAAASSSTDFDALKKALDSAKADVKTKKAALSNAEAELANAALTVSSMEESRAAYADAVANVDSISTQLEDKVFELSETKKANNSTLALQSLELEQQRKDVEEKRAKVEQLESGEAAAGGNITSEVNGVVKTIGISAGSTTEYNVAIATIEVTDRGYSAEMTVTTEQAKKVTVGDAAEVSTGWWVSSDISARLVSIRPDPQNPQTNKKLIFEISGEDVESGTAATISIGEKSRNYDTIVPNSAIRSDSNGSFVYIIVAKSSPLGNRYIATRVDVQVLAEDDTNTAVSGGVGDWDFVITTSTAPIENGMQVRMAET